MLHRQFQMLFPALGGVDCVSKTGRVGLFTNYQYYVLSKLRYLTCLVLHHLDFYISCQSNTSDKLPALRFARDKPLSCLLYEYIFFNPPRRFAPPRPGRGIIDDELEIHNQFMEKLLNSEK